MQDFLIDTHTHYAHKRFDCGRDEILQGLEKANVMAVVEGAIEFDSNQRMKLLCEKYPNVYMAAGCHPNCVEEMDDEKFKEIVNLMNYDKVIAIGETGLDYAKEKTDEQIQKQKEWFKRFIELSIRVKKPLVIHCREACDDLLKILKKYKLSKCPGVIHCFSGDTEQAKQLIQMGFYIGVNGMLTKLETDSDVCIALGTVPSERILLETDSPYLIPEGVSGKRNTSLNLGYIVDRLARLRNEEPKHIREVTLQNTKKIYPQIFVG